MIKRPGSGFRSTGRGYQPREGMSEDKRPRTVSVLPKAIEALGVHPRVPCGVGQVSVAEIRRQGPRIDALVDELEARPVPEQMRMHVGHADTRRGPAQRFEEAVSGHRRATLTYEHVPGTGRLLSAGLAQGADLDAGERLHA